MGVNTNWNYIWNETECHFFFLAYYYIVLIIRDDSLSDGAISSLTRLMYCTTSLTNDLLISSFSLWGEFYPQSNQARSPNRAKSLVFSDI